VSIFGANIAVAEPMTVGAVDRVQAHMDATQAGQTPALADVYSRIGATAEKARAFRRR
jgi:hypothetical protein